MGRFFALLGKFLGFWLLLMFVYVRFLHFYLVCRSVFGFLFRSLLAIVSALGTLCFLLDVANVFSLPLLTLSFCRISALALLGGLFFFDRSLFVCYHLVYLFYYTSFASFYQVWGLPCAWFLH